MKRLLISIGLLFISSQGFSDTLDYWHVYYNEKVIAKFNAVAKNLTINLPLNKIKKEDNIIIRHGDDTPCHSCRFFLLVRDERKRKLGITETKEFWGKLSISLSDLAEIAKKNQGKRLDFYYFEKEVTGKKSSEKLVLQVVLK